MKNLFLLFLLSIIFIVFVFIEPKLIPLYFVIAIFCIVKYNRYLYNKLPQEEKDKIQKEKKRIEAIEHTGW